MTNITLAPQAKIKEALEVIDKGAIRIAIVTNENQKVIGTISDGDIRRGLLKGLTLDSSIENIYNTAPLICKQGSSNQEIIKKAVTNRVYQVPIVDNKGSLVGVEDVAKMLDKVKKSNKVILMAGGLGTRLRPLTNDTPKPLLKVGGKPILETIIENFANQGFVDITISVNYKSKQIKEYFGNGSRFGIDIEYIDEDRRMGTAGALSLLKDTPGKPFFVMNGDLLTDIDFSKLLHFHLHGGSVATMCVREYDLQVPYGVVQIKENKITNIEEKPMHRFFANAGIYLLSPEVLNCIPRDTFYDMPTLFEELIKQNKKTLPFPIHEYWLDIGRVSDFEKANIEYSEIF